MTYVNWELKWTPFNEQENWDSGDEVTLTHFYDPLLQMKLGDSKDSFSFKVKNFQGGFDNYFSNNDKIVISRAINSSTVSTSDLLMTGTVQKIPDEESTNKNLVRVEGVNFSETIMGAMLPIIDATTLDVSQLLQQMLTQMASVNSNFQVTWNSNNPSTKEDGSPFPTVGEKIYNKSLKYIIEQYSKTEKTEDGAYYWYVNNKNELIWRKRLNSISSTFNKNTDVYKKLKTGKDTSQVKNYIIVKGGEDPNKRALQVKVADYASIAKNGRKYYYVIDENETAKTWYSKDLQDFGVDDMKDASYSLTPFWSDEPCTSYSDYVGKFRTAVKSHLTSLGQAVIDNRKYGKLIVELTFKPGKGWVLGDVISCTIPNISAKPKLLRVNEIQYSTTSDTYTLIEDEGTL